METLREVAAFEPLRTYMRLPYGSEQVRTVRSLVLEAVRQVVLRPDVAADRDEDVREQAEWRAMRIAELGWFEMAAQARSGRPGAPTIHDVVTQAQTLLRQLLDEER